jgi:hypothetical protein
MHTKNFWLVTVAILSLVTAPCAVQAQGYGYGYGPPSGTVRVGIVRALYGTRGRYVDVTRIVRRYAWPGARMEVSNETFGFDPYKGKGKKLRIIFSEAGGRYERSWDEGDTVRF